MGAIVDAARARLALPVWDYLSGGAGSESTIRRNRAALDAIGFRRRVLRDVSDIETGARLLGAPLRIPAFLAPIGSLGVLHRDGAAASARAARRFGTTLFYGVNSETPPDAVVDTGPGPVFQLYLRGDRAWWAPLVASLRDRGFRALCITVDLPVVGWRERDLGRDFSSLALRERPNFGPAADPGALARSTWDTVDDVAAVAGLPLILKGIAAAEDAILAVEAGAAAVYVSNHGGRQLDDEAATIEILPEVVAAVAGRAAVLVDGGFTRGIDILKAVALGADAVGLGKLQGWALAADGEEGVLLMLTILEAEIRNVMAQIGVRALAECSPGLLRGLSPVGPAQGWIPAVEVPA